MASIELQEVGKKLGSMKVKAVDRMNLTIEDGELLTLLGPSGCGKTTALRLIAGFEKPDNGKIFLNGELVAGNGVFLEPEKRNIGIVFQEFALFPHLTVSENVGFGLGKESDQNKLDKVREMLRLVGMEGFESRYPFELSGGQQQRVALARALAPSPLVVLLDEPFGSLDPQMRSRMRIDIKNIIKRAGVTAVFVTHDQEEAFLIADRIAIIDKGKINQIGTAKEVYHNPVNRFVADFVGKADFIPGKVSMGVISTEIGEFRMSAQNSIHNNEKIRIMLRPDDVDFVPAEFGTGTIESVEFKGEETLYSIRLKSGQYIHSSQSPSYSLNIGTTVIVIPNPRRVVILLGSDLIYHSDKA